MLQASLSLDLPSVPADPGGPFRRLIRALTGQKKIAGTDELQIAGREAFRRILWGAERGGFENVIQVVADGEPLYVDRQQRRHDLEAVLNKIEAHDLLRKGFEHLRVIFAKRYDGLHTVVKLDVRDYVPTGTHEFTARLSTRLSDLRPTNEETPLQWAERVRAFVRDPAQLNDRLARVQEVVDAFARAMAQSLGVAGATTSPVEVRVVVPGARQVGRFRHLRFGQFVRSPTYRARPEEKRAGAYDDPHVYHFFDPYHDVLSWVLLDEILAGHWRRDDVLVLHPDGTVLATASNTQALESLQFEVPRNAVTIGEGGIAVAESVPAVSGLDPAEVGSPHAPGFGGEMDG